jgi:hypothetical protein
VSAFCFSTSVELNPKTCSSSCMESILFSEISFLDSC